MAPSSGFRPSRVARRDGVSIAQISFPRKTSVNLLVCVVLFSHFRTSLSLWISGEADAVAVALPPLPTVEAPVLRLRSVDGEVNASSGPVLDSASSQKIHYEGCRAPLAVGGEIVRCEAAAADGSKPPSHGRLDGLKTPPGPRLNQLFSVEISTDWGRRAPGWQQDVVGRQSVSGGLAGSAGVRNEEEAAADVWQRMNAVSEDPHFLRVFGRWIPQARGLHMWLDREVIPAPLRRLTSQAGPGVSAEKVQSTVSPPHEPQGQELAFKAKEGGSTFALSRGRSPFLYWRQSAISLAVQNLCVALIKQPTGLGGPSRAAESKPPAVHIPDSCDEAQSLLSGGLPSSSSDDPVWLACGPQMELSRLTHYLTFAFSQAKVNRVLQALDYSVEVWREPSPDSRQQQRQQQQGGKTDLPQPGLPPNQSMAGGSRDDTQTIQTQQEASTPATDHQERLPPRHVEARRLAALQDEAAREQPKWRVGVCLLKASQGAASPGKSEAGGPGVVTPQPAGVAPPVETPSPSTPAAEVPESEKRREMSSGTAGRGLQAVSTVEAGNRQPSVSGAGEEQLVGELRFHVAPQVTSHAGDDDGKKAEPETIQIRHFIDAGWMYSRVVQGINLTRFNRLALKESTDGLARPCTGFWEQHSLLGVAPETYARDAATNQESLKFRFSNALQEGVEDGEALYNSVPGHHATAKMHVCFYSNDEQPYGLLLGEVQFVIDSADATLLVFFILFVFLAIPVTCAVAISFHIYKHRHLRERLQRLVLVQQRDAVEQLLMRELGLTAEDREDVEDDDDEEEAHGCAA